MHLLSFDKTADHLDRWLGGRGVEGDVDGRGEIDRGDDPRGSMVVYDAWID